MESVATHAALGLAIAALLDSGVRLASLATPRGLERIVAAALFAATAAAFSALVLGLASLGTNPVALSAAALLIWAASRRLLPQPAQPLLKEATAAWRSAPPAWRRTFAAATGAWATWTVWLLRYPAVDIDSVGYHLPQVAGWIGNGRPGSVLPIYDGVLPVGNYPLSNEVLVSWGMGIERGFAWASLWAPLLLALLVLAGWGALRRLGAPRWAAALGVTAVALSPIATHYQQNGANTDLPAVTWLVATGFMALCSARRPALLAPALLAAALAVGTKTSALPLAGLALLVAGYVSRRELRRLAGPLALAAAAGAAVGGYWYLRNFVDHESPLWPFVATPWGDPEPSNFNPQGGTGASLLDRPRETLDRVGADWWGLFAGGFIVIGGALVAALATRTRAALALGATTLASFLSFANAPTTGAPSGYFELAGSTVRYLGPTLVVAIATLGVAVASERRVARVLAGVLLAVGAVLGVAQTFDLGFPKVPALTTVLLGALLGLLGALALDRLRVPDSALRGRRLGYATAVVALLAGAALAVPASGWVARHAAVSQTFGVDTTRWLAAQPFFRDGDAPIAGIPVVLGPMAGDRLQHRFSWIPRRASCARVRARARRSYVAAFRFPGRPGFPSERCLGSARAIHRGAAFTVYAPAGDTPR